MDKCDSFSLSSIPVSECSLPPFDGTYTSVWDANDLEILDSSSRNPLEVVPALVSDPVLPCANTLASIVPLINFELEIKSNHDEFESTRVFKRGRLVDMALATRTPSYPFYELRKETMTNACATFCNYKNGYKTCIKQRTLNATVIKRMHIAQGAKRKRMQPLALLESCTCFTLTLKTDHTGQPLCQKMSSGVHLIKPISTVIQFSRNPVAMSQAIFTLFYSTMYNVHHYSASIRHVTVKSSLINDGQRQEAVAQYGEGIVVRILKFVYTMVLLLKDSGGSSSSLGVVKSNEWAQLIIKNIL